MKINTTLLISFLILVAACNRITGNAITGQLFSQSAAPGESVTINLDKDGIRDKQSLVVSFDSTQADIISFTANSVNILVPELDPGNTTVRILIDNKLIFSSPFTILPHPTRKVIFIYEKGGIKKIGEKLTNDELALRDNSKGRKISFDLFDEKQQLLVTGIVPHPMAGMELFEDPKGKIRREKSDDSESGTFSINVPNSKTPMKLRLYEVQLSGDSNNFRALDNRKLITEINL